MGFASLSASTVSAVGAFSFVELIAYGLVADRLLSNEKLFPRANCVGFYPHQRPRWPEGRLASAAGKAVFGGGRSLFGCSFDSPRLTYNYAMYL